MKKTKRVESLKYLSWIRQQPCCHCMESGPNHAHHIIGVGGITGSKLGDHFAVPLCAECHCELHDTFHETWLKPQVMWLHKTLARAISEGVVKI